MGSWIQARTQSLMAALMLTGRKLVQQFRPKNCGPLSILEVADLRIVEWYVVYRRRPFRHWWGRMLHPDFRHVELWRPMQYGPAITDVQWLMVCGTYEFLEADLVIDPRPPWVRDPKCTVQRVTASRSLSSIREPFFLGPMTCVEYVKAALGIRSIWLRNPHQLYRYIAKRNCVIRN